MFPVTSKRTTLYRNWGSRDYNNSEMLVYDKYTVYSIHEWWWGSFYHEAAWFDVTNSSLCTPFQAFIIRLNQFAKHKKLALIKSYVCQDSSHHDIAHLRCKHGCPGCGHTSAYWNARRTYQSTHPEINHFNSWRCGYLITTSDCT